MNNKIFSAFIVMLLHSTAIFAGNGAFATLDGGATHSHETEFFPVGTKAPETILLCYGECYDHLLATQGLETTPCPRLHIVPGTTVGILGGIGMGGPALAHYLEQLIALGTKRCLLIGFAGSLCQDLPIGTNVVCSHAFKDDGFSSLYAPVGDFSMPAKTAYDGWLSFAYDNTIQAHPATAWTFPSIFLGTPDRLKRAQARGCSVVEMEAASLYALAESRGIDALALLVVGDCRSAPQKWGLTANSSQKAITAVNELADAALSFAMQGL